MAVKKPTIEQLKKLQRSLILLSQLTNYLHIKN